MAGIGFVLRRMARRDDLSGGIQAYASAAAITCGPWLLTVAAIFAAEWWSRHGMELSGQEDFRTILSYNFCFSLVLTAPVIMVASRIAADRVFTGRPHSLGTLFLQALSFALAVQTVPALAFWGWAVALPWQLRLAALAGYGALVGLWIVVAFLTVLKEYRLVLGAVALGMLLAAVGAGLSRDLGANGQLCAFALGAAVIVIVGGTRILLEFPLLAAGWRDTWQEAWQYPGLALIGFLTAAAPWVDKWIMWASPGAEASESGLLDFPAYDGAMFLAYLSMVPGVALFFVVVETDFFLCYRRYFNELLAGASLSRIERLRRALVASVAQAGIVLLLMQTLVAALCVLLTPLMLEWGALTAAQYPVFRLGVLGALFHTLLLGLWVVLAYLDVQRMQIFSAGAFLLLNLALPALLLPLGDRFYGYGYFLAALGALLIAVAIACFALRDLNYHVFVANNPALRPRRAVGKAGQ